MREELLDIQIGLEKAKIHYDVMMESDLKGELNDAEYAELALLKASILSLEHELENKKGLDGE